MIQTASMRFAWRDLDDRLAFVRQSLLAHGHDPALCRPLEDVDDSAPPAVAWIDHGRWLALCPDPGCRGPGGAVTAGIEYVNPGEPFLCSACANVSIGYRWRLVAIPPQRKVIERELLRRPYVHQRTWLPTESVGDLMRETVAMLGLGG